MGVADLGLEVTSCVGHEVPNTEEASSLGVSVEVHLDETVGHSGRNLLLGGSKSTVNDQVPVPRRRC